MSFNYPGAGGQALHDVSFTIGAGETIAIVGRNGAGKTRLIKLLCRLYDPGEGRILLDGQDIRDYDPDELRSVIGAMFQDYVTYQATAAGNIGLGSIDGLEDRPRIEGAAHRAGADRMIAALPGRLRQRARQVVRRGCQPLGRGAAEGGARPGVYAPGPRARAR